MKRALALAAAVALGLTSLAAGQDQIQAADVSPAYTRPCSF